MGSRIRSRKRSCLGYVRVWDTCACQPAEKVAHYVAHTFSLAKGFGQTRIYGHSFYSKSVIRLGGAALLTFDFLRGRLSYFVYFRSMRRFEKA